MKRVIAVALVFAACAGRERDASAPEAGRATSPVRDVGKLSARSHRTCVVTAQKEVRCWGGDWAGRNAPEAVPGVGDVVQATLQDDHVCVLRENGTVACVGDGPGTGVRAASYDLSRLSDVVEIAGVDRHTCALARDGTVRCWGDGGSIFGRGSDHAAPQSIPGVVGARHVVASSAATCILGDVFACWGSIGGGDRAAAIALPDGAQPTAIAMTLGTTCALDAAGSLYCWGAGPMARTPEHDETSDAPRLVARMPGAVGLAVDFRRGCVWKGDGSVTCGSPRDGFTPVRGVEGAVEVVVGSEHACARTRDDRVLCWGERTLGQLGDVFANPAMAGPEPALRDVSRIEGGSSLRAWKADHTELALGTTFEPPHEGPPPDGYGGVSEPNPPPMPASVRGATQRSLGRDHGCARLSTGGAVCWGLNRMGQLGDGTREVRREPVEVVGPDGPLRGVVAVAAASDRSCALLEDHTVRCWGGSTGIAPPPPAEEAIEIRW